MPLLKEVRKKDYEYISPEANTIKFTQFLEDNGLYYKHVTFVIYSCSDSSLYYNMFRS